MSDQDDELAELREQRLQDLKESADGTGRGAPDEPIEVDTREQYEELIGSHDVVLADFYADWCGPCKMLAPVVAELADETDAAVLKVDVDGLQGLARDMGVQGVPTLLVYSDGDVAERVVGVRGKEELRSMVEAAA